jgi:anti-sigma B factor antagonist
MTVQQELPPSSSADSVFCVDQATIDAATAWDLRPALVKALYAHGPVLCLDLGRVTFIDSTGLGMLVGVLKEAREMNGDIRLINIGREVRRLLEISGLQVLFDKTEGSAPS